jgi:hypothetical protein
MKHTLVIPALSNDSKSQRKIGKNISRFLILAALSVALILAAWGIIQTFTSSLLATTSNTAAIPAQLIAGEMSGGVRSGGMAAPVTGTNFKVAPVFDAAGALVSNPTGILLNSIPLPAQYIAGKMSAGVWSAVPATGVNFKVAPLFNAAGALVSDPSGTILNSYLPAGLANPFPAQSIAGKMSAGVWSAAPMTGVNFKVAPLFNATGTLTANPSGTILNSYLPAGLTNPIPAQYIAEEMSGSVRSGGMAVPVTGANFKVAPVFDAAGTLVSNSTGMLLNSHPLGSLAIPFPAQYIVEEMLGGVRSGGSAVPVTGANFKVAPVFDVTGALVSDPTGTLWSGVEE